MLDDAALKISTNLTNRSGLFTNEELKWIAIYARSVKILYEDCKKCGAESESHITTKSYRIAKKISYKLPLSDLEYETHAKEYVN